MEVQEYKEKKRVSSRGEGILFVRYNYQDRKFHYCSSELLKKLVIIHSNLIAAAFCVEKKG